MKNYISKLYIIFFAVFFILPTVLFSLINDSDGENLENRNMAEKPAFTLGSIEAFPTEYENYYNDNLPFRSYLIKSNALLNLKVFKQSPEKKVIIGSDGWLFYNPPAEDSDPIGQCSGKSITKDKLIETAENLITIRDTLKAQDKDFVVMLCPNKESIYGEDYLPQYYNASIQNTMGDQLFEYLHNNTDLNVVYPKDEILNAINTYPKYDFYYKLDTHWNNLGGYIGASELLKAIDITLPDFKYLTVSSSEGRRGDLSDMTGLPDEFKGDISYSLNGYTQNEPVSNNLFEKIDTYTTSNADSRSVLVISDSFSEALYPYLNSQFSETNYIHITEFYPDSIAKTNPDVVILQVVERYLDRFRTFKIQ